MQTINPQFLFILFCLICEVAICIPSVYLTAPRTCNNVLLLRITNDKIFNLFFI